MLRVLAAEPAMLILGDESWRLELRADGCADLTLTRGRLHTCDIQKVALLLIQARRLAAAHFGREWCG